MDVILRDSFPKLGNEGELVRVKDGYARNYLIPQGFAFPATSKNAAEIAHKKAMALAERRRRIKTLEDMARAIADLKIKLFAKVGDEDKLFGSVTSKHIADKLKEMGYEVDHRKIELSDPIKALGVYTVPIKLSSDVSTDVQVWVERE